MTDPPTGSEALFGCFPHIPVPTPGARFVVQVNQFDASSKKLSEATKAGLARRKDALEEDRLVRLELRRVRSLVRLATQAAEAEAALTKRRTDVAERRAALMTAIEAAAEARQKREAKRQAAKRRAEVVKKALADIRAARRGP